MKRNTLTSLSLLLTVLLFSTAAHAGTIKGRVKSVAGDAGIFSLLGDKENTTVLTFDKNTRWVGVESVAGLHGDDPLTVEVKGPNNLALSVYRQSTPVPDGMTVVGIEAVGDDPAKRGATIIDTRAKDLYDAGHINGAISIPLYRLERKSTGLLPEKKDTRLIFSDEGVGGSSAGAGALLAKKMGYSNVAMYTDGLAGWINSGRFPVVSPAFIRKGGAILIDTRSGEVASAGHIEGAGHLPAPIEDSYRSRLPKSSLSPIVIYGDAESEVLNAAKKIKGWGFSRVAIFPGGMEAWQESGEVPVSGRLKTELSSSVASHGGSLDDRDFRLALGSASIIEIVDARSKAGVMPDSAAKIIRIPLAELPKRFGELNREMIQVVFADDSARAELAYDFLMSKGLRLNYFGGTIVADADGKAQLKKE